MTDLSARILLIRPDYYTVPCDCGFVPPPMHGSHSNKCVTETLDSEVSA